VRIRGHIGGRHRQARRERAEQGPEREELALGRTAGLSGSGGVIAAPRSAWTWYPVRFDTVSVRTYSVVVNLTLSLDERLVKRARKKAAAMGKSLNQVVREYLERLAGSDDAERDVAELRRLSRESRGRVRGWRFDRDELHERA
jgi:Family of unknown function (DUF6364)